MHVLVYEHCTASARAGIAMPASLLREGWAMLSAIQSDLARCPGVVAEGLFDLAEDRIAEADFTLVIAPEPDDLLARLCEQVERAGGRLLGPDCGAVRLTADKLALGQHLARHGVSSPACAVLPEGDPTRVTCSYPAVLKPRDGAGSQATYLVAEPAGLEACVSAARAEGWTGELILQPFVSGSAVSIAFLIGPGRILALPATWQHLSLDGRFRYLGGQLPLPRDLQERAERLGRRAVECVGGLRGYVGVDLVLGAAPDGSQDAVIEINPRLTTSYVGLRALAQHNLAEVLLAIVQGLSLPTLSWRSAPIRFQADGAVEALSS
jgi:predicted ATP-grasp superfamily ATP-dependent carboligase